MSRYPVPASRTRVEEVILRSRFITTIARATAPDEARSFIEEVRREFPDASHHCYAFVSGPPGSAGQAGMSDDGEPNGTAGRPMLAVLLGCGVGDIAAVVTRYWGGTKLGTGGLVRAYSGGVKLALAELPVQQRIDWVTLYALSPYHWITLITRLLPQHEAVVAHQAYSDVVEWGFRVPEEKAVVLAAALTELTQGEIVFA